MIGQNSWMITRIATRARMTWKIVIAIGGSIIPSFPRTQMIRKKARTMIQR
jgi:hypothetical protein